MFLAGSGLLQASPFGITLQGDLRTDRSVPWSGFSAVDGSIVPQWTAFEDDLSEDALLAASDGGSLQIANRPAYDASGVLLESTTGAGIYLELTESAQAVGLTVDLLAGSTADFTLSVFDDGDTLIEDMMVSTADGTPVFLGVNDPDTQIASLRIDCSVASAFAINELRVQRAVVPESDPLELPVAATHSMTVSATETYFHEGLNVRGVTPETTEASSTNDNTIRIETIFPGFRTGDLIRFERQGFAGFGGKFNPLLGVFSADETILEGREFRRLPSAIRAGTSYYTSPVSGDASFKTPTNIPEDFIIGPSSFVSIPTDAEYLSLSLASTGAGVLPTSLQLSHIPRDTLQDWITENGLHGSRAELEDDLDNDGLSLIEEFAFQKDPTTPDAGKLEGFAFRPYANLDTYPSFFTVFFGVRTDAPLRYRAEMSDDLDQWDDVPAADVFAAVDDPQRARSVFAALAPLDAGKLFMRIIIELTP